MDSNVLVSVFLIALFILCAIVWIRRKDISSIDLDFSRGKAAIEFSSGELKKIAAEIEEGKPLARQDSSLRPNKFATEVIQIGGRGSRFVNKTAWSLEEHAYLKPDEFIEVSFNQPADRMWIFCKDDYEIVSSVTPEPIFEDVIFPTKMIGLPIKEKIKNSILIHCEKGNHFPHRVLNGLSPTE